MCSARDQAKLNQVIDGDTCNFEMISYCNNRIFTRLPGLIDIKIISADNGTTLYEGDYLISIPVCEVQAATEY